MIATTRKPARPKAMPVAFLLGMLALAPDGRADELAVPLPDGVKAVWDPGKAHRDETPTRGRLCINGLWRWQPAGPRPDGPPAAGWGFFKVPGAWPGITDYMQKDSQTLHRHPAWKDAATSGLTAAWYEREVTVPREWAGRRVAFSAEYLNSYAVVFVDGVKAGEIRFPAGELDLTSACRPGATHRLSLYVAALPLKAVLTSYSDTTSARQVKGAVRRRGLCGDVYLVGDPAGPRVAEVRVETSTRKGQITCNAALEGLSADASYGLKARVLRAGRPVAEFASREITRDELRDGRISFTGDWKPDRTWDLHTPGHQDSLGVTLLDARGQALDVAHDIRFGFREFWIDGRDFYLNGTRIFLSAVPFDNAQVDATHAGYTGARESMERLKGFGINFVYTHNYDCEPGSHLGFEEILRAADDVGMLVALTQPHFSHYDWKSADSDAANGYRRHAEFYARVAGNHPSVVFYAMSHNATGYAEDMNPEMIDGLSDPRDSWSRNNATLALRAEAIIKRLDPTRIVYHHAGGNIGSMHTSNFYPNFVPVQELSDWFEHWATTGVKPVFTCEYGAPFTWDWAMYRGWYKGERSFGSAKVPWEFCFAEWNSQFLGDRSFQLSEMEKANLRWEARQFRAGNTWHRWDYPYEIGSNRLGDRHEVMGLYLADNFRAFRTWGVSATSPWEHGHFWRLREGVPRGRKELPVDWDRQQEPGYTSDYDDQRYERMDTAFERSDWVATADGAALIRNNRPLLGYIGGDVAHFTGKGHNFRPGEAVQKQIIVLNNSRETVTCDCEWSLGTLAGREHLRVPTGQQGRVPLRLELPATMAPGRHEMVASFQFSTGETQDDSFAIDVLPGSSPSTKPDARIALFDPKGETRSLLASMGVVTQPVDADADLEDYDLLIVGKAALTVDGPAPKIGRVRDGLKVILFEQASEVLEKRFGLRVQEYGLRQVFPRVVGHPLLAGLATEHLHDWRGEATILPPRLAYQMRPMHGPTIQWCGIPVTRAWRSGNRGNVASVLIEKPARGDFLPVVDGGFSLQYSPLLEFREGRGLVVFCQLDVTGRSEADPAADLLARNLIAYVSGWKPSPARTVVYAGDPVGKRHLESAGVTVNAYRATELTPDRVLVVGPGGGMTLAPDASAVAVWLKAGGSLLGLGLDEQDANALLPSPVRMKKAEHIAAFFQPFEAGSPLAGVGPADVHNRDPRDLPLVAGGATAIGDGVLARAEALNVVFCQLVPWQFEYGEKPNVKRTYRRASYLVSRLLGNMRVEGNTPLLARFSTPVPSAPAERRWLDGLYLDVPEEMDDPYRFFRW
jgi:beta-galactosidase